MFIYYLLNLLFILFKFIKNIFLYMFDLFVFVVLWILSILVLLGWLIALPFVELAALSPRMRERLRSRDYRIRERLSHLYTLREDLWFALFVKPSHKTGMMYGTKKYCTFAASVKKRNLLLPT